MNKKIININKSGEITSNRGKMSDDNRMKSLIMLAFAVIVIMFLIGVGEAASGSFSSSGGGSALYSRYNYQPSFQSYYSGSAGEGLGSRISAYWPILDPEQCRARQDLLLQVSPAGCTPGVVRSDLLAEQNVPVFCQIEALKLNPLIDIKEINNIHFQGSYPKEVLGAGFHPAKAALRTHDILLGSPLLNNIGYAVVVLKKNEKEREQPDFVIVNLTGIVRYNSGNALGIGRSEFYLSEMGDDEWERERNKQSFWKGRFFLRLEDADSNSARVSIYSGDRKVTTISAERGKSQEPVYLPGSYCRAGIRVEFLGLEAAEKKAKIEISDESGSDVIDVYEDSKFMDGRCEVKRILLNNIDNTGIARIKCKNTQEFTLRLNPNVIVVNTDKEILPAGEIYKGLLKVEGSKGALERAAQRIGKGNEVCEAYLGKVTKEGIIPAYYYIKKDEANAERWELYRRFGINESGNSVEEKLKSGIEAERNALRILKNELKAECENKELLVEKKYDAETEKYFNLTIAEYEKVAEEYGAERVVDLNESETYGEAALQVGIELAEKFKKYETKARLMNGYIERYPGSVLTKEYENEIEKLYRIDFSDAGQSVLVDNRYRNIRLLSLESPGIERASATFLIDGRSRINLGSEEEYKFVSRDGREIRFKLTRLREADRVRIIPNCPREKVENNPVRESLRYYSENINVLQPTLKIGEENKVCGIPVILEDLKIGRYARVRLIPDIDRTETKTNLTIRIGIEKRAIQLSPNKTRTRIHELNESVQKWEGISRNLGNVVKGMKGACFATAGVLTVKNFIDGIDGSALARSHAMRGEDGWKKRCSDAIASGKIIRNNGKEDSVSYKTPTECFNGEKRFIDEEIRIREDALKRVNAKLQEIEKQPGVSSGSALGANGKSVDTQMAMTSYVEHLKKKYPDEKFVQDLKAPNKNFTAYTYAELREMDYSLELKGKGVYQEGPVKRYDEIRTKVERNNEIYNSYQTAREASKKFGGEPGFIGVSARGIPAQASIYEITKTADGKTKIGNEIVEVGTFGGATHAMHFSGAPYPVKGIPGEPGNYIVIGNKKGELLEPSAVYDYNPKTGSIQISDKYGGDIGKFRRDFGISTFNDAGKKIYAYPIRQEDLKVRYFETGPDKGFAGQVPIDIVNGWYVRVRSNYRIGNQISVYDASGIPRSWDICNVGVNGRIDEEDDCQLVVDGQSSDVQILGADSRESRNLVEKSRRALIEANRNKGGKFVDVLGERYELGSAMSQYSGIECQDFMSIDDCKILFNACDPVICPASRCNLGGQHYVSDVVQSGIIGSTLLCLPNIREGVYIPVCLTGIQAGVDAYTSILRSARDCLQENLETGRTVGICDQITSVYLCEFFWRQVAPVAKVILPKIVEFAYGQGQGARGGGEYLTVAYAWQNMENSIAYFKESYAVNSLNAFRARSIEEAGGQFCKAFVSAKAPKAFETLLEPDSPPQFYASFSSFKYSDVTVPVTAQYKVFYHIFGGRDSGVYYRVYLKNPPTSAYYSTNPILQVDFGFIPRGEYRSESRDFTAPEGYKELCVDINGKEECGFNQVSSDFAVDYLREKLVADELITKNIRSEKECVSSSPSFAGAVANLPSPGAALEQGIAGENYKRGIIRICASQNPGGSINPRRYVDVGYCQDEKTRCWLDQNSVSEAVKENAGVRNATLRELEVLQKETLQKQGIVLGDKDAIAALKELEADKNRLEGFESAGEASDEGSKIIKKADGIFDQLFYNHHKAKLLLIKGQVYQKVAEFYYNSYRSKADVEKEKKDFNQPPESVTSDSYETDEGTSKDAEKGTEAEKPSEGVASGSMGKADFLLILSSDSKFYYFYDLTKNSLNGIYLDKSSNTIYRTDVTGFDFINPDDKIGTFHGDLGSGGQIAIKPGYLDSLSKENKALQGAEVTNYKVYSTEEKIPFKPTENTANSRFTFIVSGNKVYVYDIAKKEITTIYTKERQLFNDVGLDDYIGKVNGDLERGNIFIEPDGVYHISFELYKLLNGAKIEDSFVYISASDAVAPDFKIDVTAKKKKLYDIIKRKTTDFYIEDNKIFLSKFLVEDLFLGRIGSNKRIILLPEVKSEIGNDYNRLNRAYIVGDIIYSEERYKIFRTSTSDSGQAGAVQSGSSQNQIESKNKDEFPQAEGEPFE